ncbi:Shedu anti-phage system protein SduA domain-containing protein [Paraburkholderia sp. BCC1885]|uniref:Shedu anti-phage system protein SduA domain-containing protein n=1 Tax=Paraburkholderia sp. BCC1885 TaxID=2562669 RepID=UPI0011821BDB|nr:Shedu anti-phage system protein SduA domain-containing protein [Paraburkholderia sp. BCC1885]
MKLTSAREAYETWRARDPLRDFFSRWDDVQPSDVQTLRHALDSATREEDIQQFLQKNPSHLIQHLGGGHGRWIIPKQRLGSEHVTDFMIADCDSMGFHWTAVELESPLATMFTKAGNPSATLNHAIRQIRDWRIWLSHNQNYAARMRSDDGLGLTDIDAEVPGLILMGRRATESEDTRHMRRRISRESKIEIHTFDFLLDALTGRVTSIEERRNRDAAI